MTREEDDILRARVRLRWNIVGGRESPPELVELARRHLYWWPDYDWEDLELRKAVKRRRWREKWMPWTRYY